MANRFFRRLFPKKENASFLRNVLNSITTGYLYKPSEIRGSSSVASIKTVIDTMRALTRDSQISTALSYYATDATITNGDGRIIWAVAKSEKDKDAAKIVNTLLKRWNVDSYARDHILELATIGNLYIPTTYLYKEDLTGYSQVGIALDNNTIPDSDYDIIPSYKVPPEDILHIYRQGEPFGYILNPEEDQTTYYVHPEDSVIHFSLGGLLGDYTIKVAGNNGDEEEYDIKFANPLMENAVQPTQTLSLLEDALLLSSLTRIVKFVNVDVRGVEEEEVLETLYDIKDKIEQQFSLNTNTGDAQSFVNPQSPNNLIYLPKIDGNDPISITDLNMAETNDAENKLLDHYQDKKLSVLGVPKEAMNFSSNEGLGGAGSVLSQRSALYANSLERLETAYINGWTDAIDRYFRVRSMSGFIDKYQLKMQPIVTPLSSVVSEKRDAAVGQAQQLIDLLKSLGVKETEPYKKALIEALEEEFPEISTTAMSWDLDLAGEEEQGGL